MDKSQKEMEIAIINFLSELSVEREKETAEKIAKLEAEREQIAQRLELNRKIILQKQRFRESRKMSKNIAPLQERFFTQWKNISNVTKTCRDKFSVTHLMTKYNAKLRNLWMQMATINKKAKIGDLTPAHIKLAEILVKHNEDIYQSLKANIEEINTMHEEEIARKEMELKQTVLTVQQEAIKSKQMQELQNAATESQSPAEDSEQQKVRQELSAISPHQVTEVDSATLAVPVETTCSAKTVSCRIPL